MNNTRERGLIRWGGKKTQNTAVVDGLPALYPRLWRFCVVLTADRSQADDLAQATYARALEQVAKFDPDTTLDRWLFTMARRLWLNDLRATKVRRGAGLVLAEDVDISDPKPPVEVNILATEVLKQVDALPIGQRLAVLLVYVEGYSYKEAAKMLDVPIGTVMSRLATARKKISDTLGETRIDR